MNIDQIILALLAIAILLVLATIYAFIVFFDWDLITKEEKETRDDYKNF